MLPSNDPYMLRSGYRPANRKALPHYHYVQDRKSRWRFRPWLAVALAVVAVIAAVSAFVVLRDDVELAYDESHAAFFGPFPDAWDVLPDGRVVGGNYNDLWVLSADPPATDWSSAGRGLPYAAGQRISISPSGRFVATALEVTREVNLWDLAEQTRTTITFEQRNAAAWSMAFPNDQTLLFSVDHRGAKSLQTFDVQDPSAPIAIQSIDEYLTDMTALSPSLVLAKGGASSLVRLQRRGDDWDISPYAASSYEMPMLAGEFLILDNLATVAGERRWQLQVVAAEDGAPVTQLVLPDDQLLLDYDALPDGRVVITTADGLVALFDPADPEDPLHVHYRDHVLAGVRAGPENEILIFIPTLEAEETRMDLLTMQAVIERWTVDELEAKAQESRDQGCDGWSRQDGLLVLEAQCEAVE